MHMIPVQYEEFSFFGDVMYEISKKMILEKVCVLEGIKLFVDVVVGFDLI